MKRKSEVELRDGKAKLVTAADRDVVFRYLKHHCPDGDYTVVGPDIDIVCHRLNGVVYPSAGAIDGERLPPRSAHECQGAPEFSCERQTTLKVWIASNLGGWHLEECDVPMTDHVIAVNHWMRQPDRNNPSVIRWLGHDVTTDWPLGDNKVTAQWTGLGDGIGEVWTGKNEVLETVAYVYSGSRPDRERDHWTVLTAGEAELPAQRPLVVVLHRPAVRDGQHRAGGQPHAASVGLALAYAVGFLHGNQ